MRKSDQNKILLVIATCVLLAIGLFVLSEIGDKICTPITEEVSTWFSTLVNDTTTNKDTQILQKNSSGSTDYTLLYRRIGVVSNELYDASYDSGTESWTQSQIPCADLNEPFDSETGILDSDKNDAWEGGKIVASYTNVWDDPWLAVGGWGTAWSCCELNESNLGNGADTSTVLLSSGMSGTYFGEVGVNPRIRFTLCTEPCVSCTTEDVDTSNSAGDYPAGLYNSEANRWEIFYAEVRDGDTILRNARRTDPGVWQLENLGSIGGQSGSTWPGIDAVKSNLDGTNTTVACYRDMSDTSLNVVYGERGSWTHETVDDSDTGYHCAITLNESAATNEVHITYQSGLNGPLKHAWGDIGSNDWSTETLDSDTDAIFTDVEVDVNDYGVHASYGNDSDDSTWYVEPGLENVTSGCSDDSSTAIDDTIAALADFAEWLTIILIVFAVGIILYYIFKGFNTV